MSMWSARSATPSTTLPGPRTTALTSGESGSIVVTLSLAAASSRADAAGVAPSSASSSTGPRLRLWTVSG